MKKLLSSFILAAFVFSHIFASLPAFCEEPLHGHAEVTDSRKLKDEKMFTGEIDELKSELIAVFLRHTGNLSTVVYQDGDAADKTIERIALELDSKTHNSHFSHAFCFLTNLKFRFTQNVFYHIYESLEELHNPKIDIQLERRANSAQEKISQVETLLKRLAERGNDQIMLEISRFQDKFNSYLFTCISLFPEERPAQEAKYFSEGK